jgi:acyl-CoA thioester hydrolase
MRPGAVILSPMVHLHDLKVRFYELDPYNHANHSAYIQYFEVGRIELLESVGYGLATLADAGYRLVVVEIHTRFLKSAEAADVLTVETTVGKMGRATSMWEQRLLRGQEVIALQEVRFAATDLNGRPIRFPVGLATALQEYAAPEP